MDKLITNLNGGFPLELDDLRWQFTAYEKVFGALGEAIGNCVLTGCQVTGNDADGYTITPGFVIINGEIREYPGVVATALAGGPNAWKFVANDDFDATGDETFEDLSAQSCYQRRRVGLFFDAPGVQGVNVGTGLRFGGAIQVRLPINGPGPWRYVGEPGEPAFQSGFQNLPAATGNDRVRFRLEPNGIVRISGMLDYSAATGDYIAFQLPTDYRPAAGFRVLLASPQVGSFGTNLLRQAYISSDGNVKLLPGGTVSTTWVDLGAVPAWATY